MLYFNRTPKNLNEVLKETKAHSNAAYKTPEITYRNLKLANSKNSDESSVRFSKTGTEHLGHVAVSEMVADGPIQPTREQMLAIGDADAILKAYPNLDPHTFYTSEMDAVAVNRATERLHDETN